MTRSVAKRGYAATRVSDVVACADVSRRAFDRLFADKLDCLSAAHAAIVDALARRLATARRDELGFAERLRASLTELAACLAREPHSALRREIAAGRLGAQPDLVAELLFAALLASPRGGVGTRCDGWAGAVGRSRDSPHLGFAPELQPACAPA